jgi:16S rRNA G527 N7-methylase RsmG
MGEVERLRRDWKALARLQHEQQEARVALLDMERRVQDTERRQEQFTAFLARAVANLDSLLARLTYIYHETH